MYVVRSANTVVMWYAGVSYLQGGGGTMFTGGELGCDCVTMGLVLQIRHFPSPFVPLPFHLTIQQSSSAVLHLPQNNLNYWCMLKNYKKWKQLYEDCRLWVMTQCSLFEFYWRFWRASYLLPAHQMNAVSHLLAFLNFFLFLEFFSHFSLGS